MIIYHADENSSGFYTTTDRVVRFWGYEYDYSFGYSGNDYSSIHSLQKTLKHIKRK